MTKDEHRGSLGGAIFVGALAGLAAAFVLPSLMRRDPAPGETVVSQGILFVGLMGAAGAVAAYYQSKRPVVGFVSAAVAPLALMSLQR